MSIEVRPFRREDREQLTALVNAHVAAVLPGGSVSVSRVLSQLEREPGEFIVDPWVSERATLVAVQRGRVVAAAHLLRYAAEAHVGESYRGAAEIRWFLFWPDAPFWHGSLEAADVLLAACVAQLDRWQPTAQYADGTLPYPGVYGVPEQWPHVRAALRARRLRVSTSTDAPRPCCSRSSTGYPPPATRPSTACVSRGRSGSTGLASRPCSRTRSLGYVEVEILDEAERIGRQGRIADIGNLEVVEAQTTAAASARGSSRRRASGSGSAASTGCSPISAPRTRSTAPRSSSRSASAC